MEGPVEHIALWDMVFYAVRPGCIAYNIVRSVQSVCRNSE